MSQNRGIWRVHFYCTGLKMIDDGCSVSSHAYMAETFGQHIRELRQAAGLSLRELARRVGITAPYLSDIESGYRHPADKNLAALATHLGTTEEDLRRFDPRPPTKEMERLIDENPAYSLAFRQVVEAVRDQGIDPKDMLKRFAKAPKRKEKP